MIKVSVMYPNTLGARFDHTLLRDKHMPLVKARMGDACKFYTVDKGLAAEHPALRDVCRNVSHPLRLGRSLSERFWPHAKEIMGDIPTTRSVSGASISESS
jgi:uncharacterized protein (TIGR02118 family)